MLANLFKAQQLKLIEIRRPLSVQEKLRYHNYFSAQLLNRVRVVEEGHASQWPLG